MAPDAAANRGLGALRAAVAAALVELVGPPLVPALATGVPAQAGSPRATRYAEAAGLAMAATTQRPAKTASGTKPAEPARPTGVPNRHGDGELATSSVDDEAEGSRLIALVELARNGDKDAFGLLYDHYQAPVYRFLYYRLSSVQLAEDLTSETFFRALRSMDSFRWQGRDFGAWLMTIARNLTADHYKAGRTRLEQTTEDLGTLDGESDGPEDEVIALLTNEALLAALGQLPVEQRECLIMRFLQGLSIAETADVLERSPGAVKQLQLRGVRNLARLMPQGIRT